MTIEEKIGQLSQFSDASLSTGVNKGKLENERLLRIFMPGSMLNVSGAQKTLEVQKLALKHSRLKIPLLFAFDVIHGFRTIFPIPLGEAATWDLDAIKDSAKIAAKESASSGLHWTFAPMVDISRDARWGRVMEGAGEDPWYASKVAEARIQGFQGEDLESTDTVLACAKHFVAYGAAEGGRDYNTADISRQSLYETYLPPFRASVNAGVATVMSAFNDMNGVPMTGNRDLIRNTLQKDLGFKGLIVSDWTSIEEMIPHGFARDKSHAADLAFNAGIDVDMMSSAYSLHLKNLIQEQKVKVSDIDFAVAKILHLKEQLGLFKDPFRYSNPEKEKEALLNQNHLKKAREVARKSLVLLKNSGQILPIKPSGKIAVLGPLSSSKKDMLGAWSAKGQESEAISLVEGLKHRAGKAEILFDPDNKFDIESSVRLAKQADVIILAIGETADMSGETYSRTKLEISDYQKALVQEISKLHKPSIAVVFGGRPLVLTDIEPKVSSILFAWFPGSQGGYAISDILFGDFSPSGKLPMSFPRAVGQVPLYYGQKSTGRPKGVAEYPYYSRYIDSENDALYPFGFGLSYGQTQFTNLDIKRESKQLNAKILVQVDVTNSGRYAVDEVVQLYIRNVTAEVTRPVKELKAFKRVQVNPKETKTVTIELTSKDFSYWIENRQKDMTGLIEIFVGGNSRDLLKGQIQISNNTNVAIN